MHYHLSVYHWNVERVTKGLYTKLISGFWPEAQVMLLTHTVHRMMKCKAIQYVVIAGCGDSMAVSFPTHGWKQWALVLPHWSGTETPRGLQY